MSAFPSNSTTTHGVSNHYFTPLPPQPAADTDEGLAVALDAQSDAGLDGVAPVEADALSLGTVYTLSQNSGSMYQLYAAYQHQHVAAQDSSAHFQDGDGPGSDDGDFELLSARHEDSLAFQDDEDYALMQHILNTSFIDYEFESPLLSPRLSVDALGSPARPFDLDSDDTLAPDFSQARVHASPNYRLSPTAPLPFEAHGGDQARAPAAIPFDLNITLDLDSTGANAVFLMGCSQEHHAAPHGGYHQ